MRHLRPRHRTACVAMLMAACLISSGVTAAGNDCPALLPADATVAGEPRLCSPDAAGGLAVCREYRAARAIYQLAFRGGTSPVAVYERAASTPRPQDETPHGLQRGLGNRSCDLERPSGVPAHAIYRGTGVCQDEHGRSLPCSVFEHAAAREPEAMRYFVYYHPDGSGISRVDAVVAGPNGHMLEAELAYRLGQALAGTECCRAAARAYLAHAVARYPDAGIYRAALNEWESPPLPATTTASGGAADNATMRVTP